LAVVEEVETLIMDFSRNLLLILGVEGLHAVFYSQGVLRLLVSLCFSPSTIQLSSAQIRIELTSCKEFPSILGQGILNPTQSSRETIHDRTCSKTKW
jgi:hypothetical protein